MATYGWAGLVSLSMLVAPLAAQEPTIKKSYAVGDLVIPVHPVTTIANVQVKQFDHMREGNLQENRLISLIQAKISPKSWQTVGGKGTIVFDPNTISLIVCQTEAAHREIGKLLEVMQVEAELEVAAEIRIVTVSQRVWEKWLLERSNDDLAKWTRQDRLSLDYKTTEKFLGKIQQSPFTNVLEFPKLTAFNGQNCEVSFNDTFTTKFRCQVDDNGKSIATTIRLKSAAGNVDATVVGESGRTTILGGWSSDANAMLTYQDVRTDHNPIMNFLWKVEPKVSLLMITPRRIMLHNPNTSSDLGKVPALLQENLASAINRTGRASSWLVHPDLPTGKVVLSLGVTFE